jgi:copper transport protein
MLPGQASAHALLVRSDPADGATVSAAPSRLQLSFGEAVSAKVASIRIVDDRGHVARGVRVTRKGRDGLVAWFPALHRGVYAATWQVMSEDDGHLTTGTIVFGVGRPATAAASSSPGTPPTDALLKWLAFSFSALLLGGLAVSTAVLRPVAPRLGRSLRRADRGVLTLSVVGALGAVVCQLVVIERAVHGMRGVSWADANRLVASTRWGTLGVLEVVLLLVLGFAAARLRASSPRLSTPGLVVALAGAAVSFAALDALRSHAAAVRGGVLPVAATAVHLLAASVWLGGVAAFAVALTRTRPDGAGAIAASCRGRFAVLAGGAVAAVVITGLYEAGLEIVSIDGMLLSFYGRTLLVKSVLVVAIVGLGALNSRLLRTGRLSRRTVAAELAAGSVVLLAAGVLAASAPARGQQWGAPHAVQPVTVWAQTRDLLMSATIRPNRPGRNLVGVVVVSSRRPAPAPVSAVRVRLPNSGSLLLQRYAPGRYLRSVNLRASGPAKLTIVAERAGRDLSATMRWRVEPVDPARATAVSRIRLASVVDPIALLLLVLSLMLLAAAIAARGMRRRGASPWPAGVAHGGRR